MYQHSAVSLNEELTKVKEEEFSLTTLVSNEAHCKDCLADRFPLLSIYLLYPVINRSSLLQRVDVTSYI